MNLAIPNRYIVPMEFCVYFFPSVDVQKMYLNEMLLIKIAKLAFLGSSL